MSITLLQNQNHLKNLTDRGGAGYDPATLREQRFPY